MKDKKETRIEMKQKQSEQKKVIKGVIKRERESEQIKYKNERNLEIKKKESERIKDKGERNLEIKKKETV